MYTLRNTRTGAIVATGTLLQLTRPAGQLGFTNPDWSRLVGGVEVNGYSLTGTPSTVVDRLTVEKSKRFMAQVMGH